MAAVSVPWPGCGDPMRGWIGRTPLSLLKTDTGSRIAEELLIQIDEGMFV